MGTWRKKAAALAVVALAAAAPIVTAVALRRPRSSAPAAPPAAAAPAEPSEPPPAPDEPLYRVHVLERAELGRRLRGDWEPADEILLAFTEAWQDSLAHVVAAAVGQTRVTLLVDPRTTTAAEVDGWLARYRLSPQDVRWSFVPHDGPWVRDYGPLQVMPADEGSGEPLWLDAEYMEDRPEDDAVPSRLGEAFGVQVERLPFQLQGGAIVSNGRGLCASTVEYAAAHGIDVDDPRLLDDLLARLGCRALAFLPALTEEGTRHVDMFVQFIGPDAALVATVDPSDDAEDAARMNEAAEGLAEAAKRIGQQLRIVRMPMPYVGGGQYFTYVNGFRLPGDFLVPSYRVPPRDVEASAFGLLADALTDAIVVDVPADGILQRSGSLHCISLGVTLPARLRGGAATPLEDPEMEDRYR